MAGPDDLLARSIPAGGVGPGGQPEEADGAELQYLSMPGAMHTYRQPMLPEPADADACAAGLGALRTLRLHLTHYRVGALPQVIDLSALPPLDRQLVTDSLGEAAGGLDVSDGAPGFDGPAPRLPAHVVNLTLLPQSEQDLECLGDSLGRGPVSMLCRGYGNCRVTVTGLRDVWWVQYFNSDDKLILNTLEVTPVPAAVLAAQEDLDDSAERLREILAALTGAAA